MLILAFLKGGQVALEEDGEQVWSSDDDDEFTEAFADTFFDPDDAEEIIEYLVQSDVVSDAECDDIEVESESIDGADVDSDADEATLTAEDA